MKDVGPKLDLKWTKVQIRGVLVQLFGTRGAGHWGRGPCGTRKGASEPVPRWTCGTMVQLLVQCNSLILHVGPTGPNSSEPELDEILIECRKEYKGRSEKVGPVGPEFSSRVGSPAFWNRLEAMVWNKGLRSGK